MTVVPMTCREMAPAPLATKRLRKKNIIPKLASIIVGDDPASILYVNLKKKAAERIGCELLVVSCERKSKKDDIIEIIKKYNEDKSVHGIMVRLPLPKNFSKEDRDEIINAIAKEKDVDGLRNDSLYLTPTAKAILEVIHNATPYLPLKDSPLKVVVVGAGGFEGKKIIKVFKDLSKLPIGREYDVEGIDRRTDHLGQKTKEADVLISVTGSQSIIGKEEIKEGAIIIDVGSPKGDVRTEEVMNKAHFISPVPGGVGPVTIVCLLENLLQSTVG